MWERMELSGSPGWALIAGPADGWCRGGPGRRPGLFRWAGPAAGRFHSAAQGGRDGSDHFLRIQELGNLFFRQDSSLPDDFTNLPLLPVRLVGELCRLVVPNFRGQRRH